MSHSITKFFFLLGTLLFLQWDAQATNLILDDFEDPVVANGTSNPAFSGGNWVYESAQTYGRNSDNQSDVPTNGGRNQVIDFNQNTYMRYDFDHAWGAGNTYMLSFNASENNWANSWDRGLDISIRETNGTVLWTYLVTLSEYSGAGGNPWTADQTFSFVIPASIFTTGTPGTNIRFEMDCKGGSPYLRGLFVDNIDFSEGTPPVDNTPPSPDPMTFSISPSAVDHQHIYMRATNAVDEYLGTAEYFFENITTGSNSGWQSDLFWSQANVITGSEYQFRVKARDLSSNQNETAWSSLGNITVSPYPGNGTLLAAGNFETPGDYNNGETDIDFIGWKKTSNNVKVRTGGSDGTPVDTINQVIQFEYTNRLLWYDMTHTWTSADSYQLNINVTPQAWSGSTQRYFEVRLEQQDGTDLWTDVGTIPLYDASFQQGPWTPDRQFSFSISAASFSTGTPGEPLRLTILNENSGGRGIFIDDVVFRQVFSKGTLIRVE